MVIDTPETKWPNLASDTFTVRVLQKFLTKPE